MEIQPFCFAAASGVVRIAELMVEKNQDLPLIRGFNNAVTPLFIAVSNKCTEMVPYLLSITDLDQLDYQEENELLIATIHRDFYGKYQSPLNLHFCLLIHKL